MLYRALGFATWMSVIATLCGCGADVDQEPKVFCLPGAPATGEDGATCACLQAGRKACVVGTRATQSWMCGSDDRWTTVDEGACTLATAACREPMGSLQGCFERYSTCVMRVDGSVCGYR